MVGRMTPLEVVVKREEVVVVLVEAMDMNG